jgi:hypothetical protein
MDYIHGNTVDKLVKQQAIGEETAVELVAPAVKVSVRFKRASPYSLLRNFVDFAIRLGSKLPYIFYCTARCDQIYIS